MRTRTFEERWLAGLFLTVVGVAAVWATWAGGTLGELRLLPCPVLGVTGVPCPGCGITRASVALVSGDLAGAWRWHPFAYLLVPMAFLFLALPARTRRAWAGLPRTWRRGGVLVTLGLCLALWVGRLG